MKFFIYNCSKCSKEHSVIAGTRPPRLKMPCDNGACDGTLELVIVKRDRIQRIRKPRVRRCVLRNMERTLQEINNPGTPIIGRRILRRIEKNVSSLEILRRKEEEAIREIEELHRKEDEKRKAVQLQKSERGVCKLIHQRQVLAELEQDKESLFLDDKKIKSMLKVKCKKLPKGIKYPVWCSNCGAVLVDECGSLQKKFKHIRLKSIRNCFVCSEPCEAKK